MKLRNKKTGEIIDVYKGQVLIHYDQGRKTIQFNSLEDLEEWEDYKEPMYYFIADTGVIKYEPDKNDDADKFSKRIGNYFNTWEEANDAMEKLKAWKRLKDKGLTFCGWKITDDACSVDVETTLDAEIVRAQQKYITDDLNLLFGGEE